MTDLEAHFAQESACSDIEDLLRQAGQISQRYLSARSAQAASMSSNVPGIDAFPNGSPWIPSEKLTSTNSLSMGDLVLGNAITRMLDSMLHYEFHHSIAGGDIGRAMNVMAVRTAASYLITSDSDGTLIQVWTFTFTGSGKGKYSNELLELACNFKYEYSAELKELILNNWLVNLSGIEGCWFPMDLMQEHNIKQLKKLADRRDSTFGGTFFQEVISMNIRATLHANDAVRAAVRLGSRGGVHPRRQKKAAEKRFGDAMTERELHRFRAGRTYGYTAHDDFAHGYNMLMMGTKIINFIARTMVDAGAIHDEEGAAAGDEEPEEHIDLPPTPGIIVDGVLVTGEALDEVWDGSESDLEDDDVEMANADSDDVDSENEYYSGSD